MNSQILAAIIAGVVSLAVGVSSYLASRRALKIATHKLERELQRRLTEKLLDLRLGTYPQAIQITDQLLGEHIFGGHIVSADLVSVREQLAVWSAGKGGLLLSIRSLRSYYKLRNALRVAKTNKELSEDELKEVWHAKNSFRKSLRRDISLLYSEEQLPEERASDGEK